MVHGPIEGNEAAELITRTLSTEPEARGTAGELKTDQFFKDINWESLVAAGERDNMLDQPE